MIYGYCRVSTTHQRITRQVTNITELYPEATLIKEYYTGTTQSRPLWDKLLIFLNEPLINTSIFDSTKTNLLEISVKTGNTAIDDYFTGNINLINNLLMALAEEQIKSAFLQSEKEVSDLHSRISQGIREAKKNGTQIGLEKGTSLTTEKSIRCKEIIKKHAVEFGGTLNDSEVIILCKISRNSYYKYKRELKLQNT